MERIDGVGIRVERGGQDAVGLHFADVLAVGPEAGGGVAGSSFRFGFAVLDRAEQALVVGIFFVFEDVAATSKTSGVVRERPEQQRRVFGMGKVDTI